jgi:hypothetical protein
MFCPVPKFTDELYLIVLSSRKHIMPINFPENVISCIFFATNFPAPQLLLCHFLRFADIIDLLDESLANAEMVAIAGLSSQTFITYLLILRVKHIS